MSYFSKFFGNQEPENVSEDLEYLRKKGGEPPKLSGWEFLTHIRPFGKVGGDFIHWYSCINHSINYKIARSVFSDTQKAKNLLSQYFRVGVSLVDVMDHGELAAKHVPQAHKTLLDSIERELDERGNITTNLVNSFERYLDFKQRTMMTLIYAEFNRNSWFKFITMGHQSPYVWNVNKRELFEIGNETSNGSIIGSIDLEIPKEPSTYRARSGDVVIMASDGLFEHGVSENGELYPLEKVIFEIQGAKKDLDLLDLKEGLKEDMGKRGTYRDDVSIILAKKL